MVLDTSQAIQSLVDLINKGFDGKLYTFASFYYPRLCQLKVLSAKLEKYGFDALSRKLVESYLSDRCQYVTVGGKSSANRAIRHGVPQGSVLGPILFLIYNNDRPNFSGISKFTLFADDTTEVLQGTCITKIMSEAAVTQAEVETWYRANKLTFNQSKTQQINFTLRRTNEN